VTDHPVNGLDDVVHQRVRLGILAVTQQARRVEFGYLRAELGVTAGNLSQHLSVLEQAGLITIDKGYDGKRPRTWLQLTKDGKKALHKEITSLKALIREVEAGGVSPRSHP
jgi:DNA-binding MarR family transcriptional regulator